MPPIGPPWNERESGTARLEEAVAAWDLCLTVAESAWRPQSVQELLGRRAEVKAEIKRRASR